MLHTATEQEQKARDIQREYYRQWRMQNKDKIKEYNRRYWEKKAQQKEVGACGGKEEI